MKISVISDSFYESTFPLVKHLSKHIQVDLYCIVQQTFLTPSMLDLSKITPRPDCGIYSPAKTPGLIPAYTKEYFAGTGVRIFLVVFSGGKKYSKDIQTSLRLSRLLKKEHYNIYHFIGTYVLFPLVESRLRKERIIHTLHESSNRILMLEKNRLKYFFIKRLFQILKRKKVRLIFHSENVRNEYHQAYRKDPDLTAVIPFGLFEGYFMFPEVPDLQLPEKKFLLFIGYIHPYKGVDLLIEAAISLEDQKTEIPFVIAGKDATNIRERYKIPSNVLLIDRYLKENEIVTLIKKCHAIALPYISSSQSGIPNTCFCFHKPVIASDLEGIKTIVFDEINGLLFPNQDVKQLEKAILRLWNDNALYKQLADNIKGKRNIEWTDWDLIAEKTLALYEII